MIIDKSRILMLVYYCYNRLIMYRRIGFVIFGYYIDIFNNNIFGI